MKKLPNLDLGIPSETEQKLGNKLVGSVKAGWLQYRVKLHLDIRYHESRGSAIEGSTQNGHPAYWKCDSFFSL